jgi:undecaprenol kinase
MKKISRDEIKKRGLRRCLNSFKYSVQGLTYAYKYEQSMFIHAMFTLVAFILNIFLKVSSTEWLITLLCLGVVLSIELINTAIEAVVDLVTLEIHPLAKIAKDCGSAATFVVTMLGIVICIIIYFPYFLKLFGIA